jgi:hypothetical protein
MNFCTLAIDNEIIPVIAIVGGLIFVMTTMILKTIRRTAEIRAREESRREIAAYVAEGSMTSDDAYKLMNAGTKKDQDCA